MGESWPRSSLQTERSDGFGVICVHTFFLWLVTLFVNILCETCNFSLTFLVNSKSEARNKFSGFTYFSSSYVWGHKRTKSTLIQWNLDLTNLYLYNKVLDITNDFLFPNSRKYMKKNLDIMNYSEQMLSVPWPFVKSGFHCTWNFGDNKIWRIQRFFENS